MTVEPPIEKNGSGGQTGADRAALYAIASGIPHGGWCPKGRRAENGPIGPGYALAETPRADYLQRTEPDLLYRDVIQQPIFFPETGVVWRTGEPEPERKEKKWLHSAQVSYEIRRRGQPPHQGHVRVIHIGFSSPFAWVAELFQTTPQNITLHLRAIYAEGELEEGPTCKDYLQVRQEGAREVQRSLRHYNLDVRLDDSAAADGPK